MPTLKNQSLYSPKALRRLQRLVQLSDTPLVRTLTTALIHQQLWIMGALFRVTLIFTVQNPASWLTIKQLEFRLSGAASR
ncbi:MULTISPECIES: hypothetical protein [Trichocoleus]|uniref:Uncharacterized protein n=1 Tax=Trichocoleus desertorum GB2-A4 TaxID=2933944 RepID=A0ABV0JEY8_9CYAN|nr:hypothetical protein [Trichocoleus sp. FACHB-46]MBD1864492.1 hypothetical protein [Trichocoleus sp. FACHB-46]